MFLLIDNYDSFTYNLFALFRECGAEVDIIKNDVYRPGRPLPGDHPFARTFHAGTFRHHAPLCAGVPGPHTDSSGSAWACRPWPIRWDTRSSGPRPSGTGSWTRSPSRKSPCSSGTYRRPFPRSDTIRWPRRRTRGMSPPGRNTTARSCRSRTGKENASGCSSIPSRS